MFGTKFSAIAMAAVRIAAAGAVGMAVLAGALLIVGPALLGHGVAPWLISAHPRVQAAPTVRAIAARRYRDDLNCEPHRDAFTHRGSRAATDTGTDRCLVIGTASVNHRVRRTRRDRLVTHRRRPIFRHQMIPELRVLAERYR
jgi:hypothetical protein